MRQPGHACMALFFLLGIVPSGNAAQSQPILEIQATACCDGKGHQQLTLQQLDALPQTTVTTTTPWTEDKHTYSGVRRNVLLQRLNIHGNKIKASALNNYWAVLPLDDANKYPVILATRQDGKPLTRRNKGPIFIIYPLSDYPELDQEQTHSFMVWQVKRLDAE